MANRFPTVAVLGAGQLARMMQSEAVELGVNLRPLAGQADEPAAQVCPQAVVGDLTDSAALAQVTAGAQVVTFEHELIPAQTLDWLTQRLSVQPSPEALLYAQNKVAMRRRLSQLGLPMPAWAEASDAPALDALCQESVWPLVAKVAHGGYDGRGVALVQGREELDRWLEQLEGRQALVEQRIDFVAELAVLGARRPSGESRFWPVVQTVQVDGQCAEVTAPAPGLDAAVAQRANQIGAQIGQALGITGVFAVEMFLDGAGQLYINELAMRPHNSGHWTQDGAVTSQFEQHLRAVLDLPLGDTAALAPVTVMCNVLGSALDDPASAVPAVLGKYPQAKIHLYGKGNRPQRKLGHINVRAADVELARAQARAAAAALMGRAALDAENS